MTRRALTLTELIIATVIIGIIMIGVVSSDYAVRNHANNQGAGAVLTLNTRVLVDHIMKNAALAIGDKNNLGFSFAPNAVLNSPPGFFCVRQDINNTPSDYSDDQWACYTVLSNSLYACARTAVQGPGACTAANTLVGAIVSAAVNFSDTTDVFLLMVTNRADPAKAQSTSNPQVTVTSQVSPAGQSI